MHTQSLNRLIGWTLLAALAVCERKLDMTVLDMREGFPRRSVGVAKRRSRSFRQMIFDARCKFAIFGFGAAAIAKQKLLPRC
jgi:hypothetical protein